MDDAEVGAFLDEERTVICATVGRDGTPHLMPLWYIVRDGEVWVWTYGASQKVRNLERDPRATLLVEAGEVYDQLRGVMLRTEAVIVTDAETIVPLGLELFQRYLAVDELPDDVRASIERQARKRVAIRFVETGPRATWDHRKLGGSA